VTLKIRNAARYAGSAAAIFLSITLIGCGEEEIKPSENNTYYVHLYYGKDVKEHKQLGQVVGISECKKTVHQRAAIMKLKPHSYRYDCCLVYAGDACYQKHK
jgi:hypothetical protein